MEVDFILKLVRPRVANQMDFDLSDSFDRPIVLGVTVRNDIGRRGIFDPCEFLGTYRSATFQTGRRVQKLPFYRPHNPRSEAQTANRSSFAAGAAAWQALSPSDKMSYNNRAKGSGRTGYNLFLKQYLNTN